MNISIGTSKTVDGRELLICNKQPENKELIKEITKHYAGMLRTYKNKYSKEEDFEFSFTLTVGDTIYYHNDIRKLLKGLSKLENEDKFIIDVKYNGYVEVTMGVFQNPKFYFGEFGVNSSGISHLLCDELKGCVEYKHFHYAADTMYEFLKFDKDGLKYIDNYVEENPSNIEGYTSLYTDGISMLYDIEDDMDEKEVENRKSIITVMVRKYVKEEYFDEGAFEDVVGFCYMAWFLNSYSEIVDFVDEINQYDWVCKFRTRGFWYDLETFTFVTIENENGKIVVKGIRA